MDGERKAELVNLLTLMVAQLGITDKFLPMGAACALHPTLKKAFKACGEKFPQLTRFQVDALLRGEEIAAHG